MRRFNGRIGEVFQVSYVSYRDTTAIIVEQSLNGYEMATVETTNKAVVPQRFWLPRGEIEVLQRNGALICGWDE